MHNDMLADLCPFERVFGLDRAVFAGQMLDRCAESVINFTICIEAGGDVLVGVAEIVSGGIVGIAREIGKDAMDVHYVL